MKCKFNASRLDPKLVKALGLLGAKFGFELADDGIELVFNKCDEPRLNINCDGKVLNITAPTKPAFFRGIGLYIVSEKGEFSAQEDVKFDMNGLMFDCSRNGVLSVERTKDFLLRLAMLGMNTYLPYMEDVYEIPDEQLFGYMRGRYTAAELREIDDFADLLGIEVIACIQTLAHLNQFLKWNEPKAKYRDIDDIMLVGSEDVNALIDKMLATLSGCLRSRRIHIGMDEAYKLGRGKYLTNNGFVPKGEIMKQHLAVVRDIAAKYGLKMMMWDDMFFWNSSGQADMSKAKPADIAPVYWDYYNSSIQHYEENIDLRMAVDKNVVFAGGAWRWAGFAPRHSRTISATDAAMTACLNRGVKNVFTTAWGDDGNEAPSDACLLGVTMFAEYGYGHVKGEDTYKQRLEFISGMDFDTWMMQEAFDVYAMEDKDEIFNPHYYSLYSDLLCGTYDAHIEYLEKYDPTGNYNMLHEYFAKKALESECKYNTLTLNMFAALAKVLALKWDIGIKLARAYKADDTDTMRKVLNDQIVPLIPAVEELRVAFNEKWLADYKLNGLEIIDIRLGGIQARARTAQALIDRYLAGDTQAKKALSCLEEPRIYVKDKDVVRADSYLDMSSGSAMCHNITPI